MQVEAPAMSPEIMSAEADGESTAMIAARASHAYGLQVGRQGKAKLGTREIDRHCRLDRVGDKEPMATCTGQPGPTIAC